MYIGDEYMLKFSIIGAIEPDVIVLISVISAIFVGVFTVSLVRYLKNKKIRAEEANREVEEVDVKKGIRYTEDATIVDKTGEMNVTYNQQDLILRQNKTYTAKRQADIKPGKYTILSARDNEETFNVRIGVYVKEYKHGQTIVLGEGEEITPVSTDIILR